MVVTAYQSPSTNGSYSKTILTISLIAYQLLARRTITITVMSKQTALLVTQVGGRVHAVSDWPVPQPGPKQVQIRVNVAGLNPHDQKARDTGLFIKDNLPAILGNDVTGVITVLGSEVTKYKVGDRIVSQSSLGGNTQNALQQYVVLDEDFTAKIPVGFKDDEAATIPTNALAGLIALFNPSGLGIPAPWASKEGDAAFDYAGTTLLIIGGGSNCGRFGVQLAHLAGIGTIVVVGGSEEELKRYGATHVLDRHGGDEAVLARIRDIVGDNLIYAYDTVNPPAGQHLALSALSSSKTGRLARLLFSSGAVDESKILGEKKEGFALRNVLGLSHINAETAKPFWGRLSTFLEEGKLVPLAYETVKGLDEDKVNEVLDRYRDGKKVVQTHFRVSDKNSSSI
ncbi:hypothetical protein TW65_01471 [Stemphylium lycopersici]|nr:hypothetical protein TW65_01471 [Stemphylium lycopersici]